MKTNETSKQKPNYRIYDGTGGGVTEDVYATSLDDAIEQGRAWIESGDWGEASTKARTLACSVAEIIYDEDGDEDKQATRGAERHDCSGVVPIADAPECEDGDAHDWQSPHKVVGGCGSNPGCFGSLHGQVSITAACAKCGIYRCINFGATDPDNGLCCTEITYQDADEKSLAWVAEQEENADCGKQ